MEGAGVGAVDTLGRRKAFEDLKKFDGGSWAWGQRALTRISELRTLANLMARLARDENQDAAALAEDARQHLRVAKEAIEPPDGGSSHTAGPRRHRRRTASCRRPAPD
jgi:hypothetical protein